MPKNAAHKSAVRARQRSTGEPYSVARRHADPPTLPFDLSWLNLDVVNCPVCQGSNVLWLLRDGNPRFEDVPRPGEMTDFVRPTDPGYCGDCFANGQSSQPDAWRLPNGLNADECPECDGRPVKGDHLPWNDGKHQRCTNFDDGLVPADGRWYRYECADGHWWISAPAFTSAPPT